MLVPLIPARVAVLLGLVATLSAQDFNAEQAELTKGVREIAAPGAPGAIAITGTGAFAVAAGKSGDKSQVPVVAAAHYGKGRVVAFGHGGYLSAGDELDTGTLILNSVKWAGSPAPALKVTVRKQPLLLKFLKAHGISADDASGENWIAQLKGIQVLCIDAHSLSNTAEADAVRQWVSSGGGLLTAATGWGWAQTHPDKVLATDFPGNQLLSPAGLTFTGGIAGKTTEHGMSMASVDSALLNASSALDQMISVNGGTAKLTTAQLAQASTTVTEALRSLPPSDPILIPRVAALKAENGIQLPSPGKPLTPSQTIPRLLLVRDVQLLGKTPPQQLTAHPAADAFPGAVPADAPRITKVVSVNTAVRDWHSTGLYAAPGAKIEIRVPAGTTKAGLSVRIGCHTDSLWNHDKWPRVPEISRTEKLTQAVNAAANPFGGLVYIEVPRKCTAGIVEVTITGGVQAPFFELGKTSLAEWKNAQRAAPAPWAELATKKVILTVPSTAIRGLEDPEELLKFWDSVLDAEADLAAISHDRERPERIVADVDISAGYMHSGYPIMTHLDVAPRAMTLQDLRSGGWGFWHELGHNHQVSDWTFGGTTEVTCNLFSLYVCETLCGMSPGQGHEAMVPGRVADRLAKHVAANASFDRWKADPFLALTMYLQLRNAFGWETYKRVFAEYRNLSPAERPKSDEERRDQWMVRFSKAAGRNLGPFFQAWGVPTSEQARSQIATLPGWMPDEWPK